MRKQLIIKDGEVIKLRMLLDINTHTVQFEESIALPAEAKITAVLPLTFEQLESAYNFMKRGGNV